MRLVLLLLALLPMRLSAEVLISDVPPAKPERIIAVVRQAFISRQWTIEKVESNSVAATLNHRGVKARMTITLDGSQLAYDIDIKTHQRVITNPAQNTFVGGETKAFWKGWVQNLKMDIEKMLVVLPY